MLSGDGEARLADIDAHDVGPSASERFSQQSATAPEIDNPQAIQARTQAFMDQVETESIHLMERSGKCARRVPPVTGMPVVQAEVVAYQGSHEETHARLPMVQFRRRNVPARWGWWSCMTQGKVGPIASNAHPGRPYPDRKLFDTF